MARLAPEPTIFVSARFDCVDMLAHPIPFNDPAPVTMHTLPCSRVVLGELRRCDWIFSNLAKVFLKKSGPLVGWSGTVPFTNFG